MLLDTPRSALDNGSEMSDSESEKATSDLDRVIRRLAEIIDELAALPEGPSSERFHLLTERDALRREAAQFASSPDAHRSTSSLEAELEALKGDRTAVVKSRGGYITGDGADSAGRVGAALSALGGRARPTAGTDRFTVRISQIEDALATRRREGRGEP